MKDAKHQQVNSDVETKKTRFVVTLCTVSFSNLLSSVELIIWCWQTHWILDETFNCMSLDRGKWLTDNIADAAQALLKKMHIHIGGLVSVALGQTLAFTIQHGEFVQILNVSNDHWIIISNIGCKSGHINVYDSMGTNCVPPHTKEQVGAILFGNNKKNNKQVQGGSDCRVFAPLSTALCSGKDPTDINFIQHKLRSQLKNCLMQNYIKEFQESE